MKKIGNFAESEFIERRKLQDYQVNSFLFSSVSLNNIFFDKEYEHS